MDKQTAAPKISNLASHVRLRLDELLDTPEWRQGGRLPPEGELARRLQVSRPTLRKALIELREEGRIVSNRGSGNFVQPVAGISSDIGDITNLTIRTTYDMKRCLRFRMSIECAAAEEAAIQHDPVAIEALAAATGQYKLAKTGESFFAADFAFHLALAHATLNPYFPFVLQTIKEQIRLTMEFSRKLRDRSLSDAEPSVISEHERILKAVATGNPQEARKAMEEHMQKTLARVMMDG